MGQEVNLALSYITPDTHVRADPVEGFDSIQSVAGPTSVNPGKYDIT
jgi:hypothetical protein